MLSACLNVCFVRTRVQTVEGRWMRSHSERTSSFGRPPIGRSETNKGRPVMTPRRVREVNVCLKTEKRITWVTNEYKHVNTLWRFVFSFGIINHDFSFYLNIFTIKNFFHRNPTGLLAHSDIRSPKLKKENERLKIHIFARRFPKFLFRRKKWLFSLTIHRNTSKKMVASKI